MSPIWKEILLGVLGASGVFSFIMFLISRHDKKIETERQTDDELHEDIKTIKEDVEELNKKADKSERDNVRTQLLLLMACYPDNVSEIMECAKHYFVDMEGNWYLTPLFIEFVKSRKIAQPEWLLKNNTY